MALRVWLPLNGNLNNQGLSDVTVTNNGATVNTNGKIGSCYSMNGSSNYIQITNLPNPQTISVAFWMKRNATTNSRQFMFTAWSGITCEMTADNRIHCYVAPSYGGCDSPSTVTVDTGWVHIAYTYDSQVGGKLYLNGSQVTQSATIGTITWSTTTGRIGNYSNMYYNGCMNDFRIYDHVLSPREVSELAKAKILHYPLSREGFGAGTILPNTWPEERTFEYPTSSFSDRWSCITTIIPTASKYTLSFWAKSTVAGDQIRTHFYSPNTTTTCVSSQGITKQASDGNMDFTLSTEWKRYWVTYSQNNTTAVKHLICPRMGAVGNTQGICYGTGTVSIKQIKLEEGDTHTPWIPASTDSLYSAMGLNSDVIYDVSGYQNNGTTSGVAYSADTPKYNICTVFNFDQPSGIQINNTFDSTFVNRQMTFAFWMKRDNYTDSIQHYMYNDICQIYTYTDYKLRISWRHIAEDNSYDQTNTWASGLLIPANEWHHICYVFDSGIMTLYYDGAYYKESDRTDTGQLIGTRNYGWIGHAYGSTTNMSYGGSLSDFRIYATALSAEDIKELYQVSASIDSSDNLLASEMIET